MFREKKVQNNGKRANSVTVRVKGTSMCGTMSRVRTLHSTPNQWHLILDKSVTLLKTVFSSLDPPHKIFVRMNCLLQKWFL